MIDNTSAQSEPQTDAEYEVAFEQIMAELDCINERGGRDRIERLAAETKLLAEETARLRTETRAMLAEMGFGVGAVSQAEWEQRRERDQAAHDRKMAALDREDFLLRQERERLRATFPSASCPNLAPPKVNGGRGGGAS